MKKSAPKKESKKPAKKAEEKVEEVKTTPAEEQKPQETPEETAQAIPQVQPTTQESSSSSIQPEIKLNMRQTETAKEETTPTATVETPAKEEEQKNDTPQEQTKSENTEQKTPVVAGSENKTEGDSKTPPENPDDKFAIFDNEEEKPKLSILKIVLLFILGFVVGGASVGAFLYFNPLQKSEEKKMEETTPAETPTPEAMQEKSEEATDSAQTKEVNFSEYSVQILNGSGIAGAAGTVEDLLKEQGFEIFETGNADSYDYENTEVQIIGGLPKEVYDTIEKGLENYTVTLSEENLPEDSQYDVVIIVGQKK